MNTAKSGWRRLVRLNLQVPALVFLLAGCSLPAPQSDPTRFYVLSTPAPQNPVEQAGKNLVIHLRPVELASYIRGKPMIVRRGANEIEFREYARWGEPLELGISRVLREELLARGAASAVIATGVRAVDVEPNYELTVRVLACEGNADGTLSFRAFWELATSGATPKAAGEGDYRATGLKWDGKNDAALAAQLSDAVAGLAADIAAGLAKTKG